MTGLSSVGGNAIGALATAGSGGLVAIPIADIGRGAWTSSSGGGIFEAVNETSFDDSDSVFSSTNPVNDVFVVLLQEVTDPSVDFGHVLKYRFRKTGAGRADIIVKLKQADTVIATFSHSDINGAYTLAEQRLADAQAASITNYADLRVEITATKL